MAKIKINGDSSGYVELAAPNAAHNNTLELGPGTKILTDKNTHTSSIGIGTDNPTETLTLNHANGASIGLEYSGTENGTINVNSAAMYVRAGTGKHLILGSNGTEKLRIDSSGRLLKSGQASLTSTTLSYPIQVAAASDANAIAIFGRAADDIGELAFYEADKSTKLGELQYRQDHINFRHRVGYISFATGGLSERLRIGSGGGHKITCAEGYYAANLTECNDGRIALNINQTRQGQTKAIAIGAISANSATGIQCYDTSNNSANNLLLNPFGGNMGLGTNNPTSDGGTTFEIYDDNTPSIRLNDGGAYKALFQLRGNDLEIRGSNGQLEFYTGNADGASSSLRGAITSAGHKWTHNGSIFHGSNDVTDFTDASRDTYNNVSIRAGYAGGDVSPSNRTSAIKIYPAGTRNATAGTLTGGIAWQHLDPNNGSWGSNYGEGSQIWMGAALHDTPGQERDRFNLWMNSGTTGNSQPGNLAIEAYPNGMVRHPKVPAFYAYTVSTPGLTSSGDQVFNNTRLNNGSCYSTSNGRFTAPIDGIYLFSTSVQLYGQGSAVSMSFRINGTDFHGSASSSQPVYDERAGTHDNLLFTAVVSLSQNDYLTVYTNQGIRGMQSYFTGHLVG